MSARGRRRIGFLIDPLEGLRFGHDTTVMLMLEAQRQGHEVLWGEHRDLSWRDGAPCATLAAVELGPDGLRRTLARTPMPLASLDALLLRKDPPFDAAYLHATLLVEHAQASGTFVMNAPRGLREANEKLYGLRFKEHVPTTIVSSELEEIYRFAVAVGGRAVLKPLDGYGGRGVLLVHAEDPTLPSLVELATQCGRQPVIAQEYLAAAVDGDKRVLMLNGEVLGAVIRKARAGEFRCNMAVGGVAHATTLTLRERQLCEAVGQALTRDGLWFVGLDVIGERLTEVNVTSPTGLVEASALSGTALAPRVIDFVISRCRAT